jgi:TonB family protein
MLKQPIPTVPRWIAGSALVAALSLLVGYSAWAAQPVRPAPDQEVVSVGSMVPPRYPAEAASQGVGGKVNLVIDVDAQGHPADIEVESAEPAGVFDQAAVDAARNWRFEPKIENGKPVASRIRVPLEFEPDRPAPPAPPAPPARPAAPPAHAPPAPLAPPRAPAKPPMPPVAATGVPSLVETSAAPAARREAAVGVARRVDSEMRHD